MFKKILKHFIIAFIITFAAAFLFFSLRHLYARHDNDKSGKYNIKVTIAAEDFDPLLRIAPIAWDIIEISVNKFYTTIIIEDFHLLVREDPKIADSVRKMIVKEIASFLHKPEKYDLLEDFIHTRLVLLINEKLNIE